MTTTRKPPAGPTRRPGPAAPTERLGAVDEAFWHKQEARLAGRLGQPCCTLSGMCSLLGTLQGSFAVVIHGERDCGNSFVAHRMVSAEQFYCTGITELQATTGRLDEPLERCLRLVLAEQQPEVVLVLSTCMVTMIGADPQPVVDRVAADTDTPLLLLRTGGLQLSSQAEMVDWLYESLAGLPQQPAREPSWRRVAQAALQQAARDVIDDPEVTPERVRARVAEAVETSAPEHTHFVNLIGLPRVGARNRELRDVLGAAGIAVAGQFPFEAELADWQRISLAHLDVVVDRRLYPRLLRRLEQEHGLATLEVPLPVGLGQSQRFYRRIGAHFGVEDAVEDALQAHAGPARDAVEAFRARARGLRVAVGVRMLNNYQVDQLAYEGLGDVEALAELGFDVTLLIQGPPEERPRFGEMLERLECALPFHVFPSPWNLAPLLAEGDYQVAYLADHCREEALKAGVPMINSRGLAPLLGGVLPNLAVLEALLHTGRADDPGRRRR